VLQSNTYAPAAGTQGTRSDGTTSVCRARGARFNKNHDEWRPTAQQIAQRFAAESGFAAFLRATIFGTFSRKSTKQGKPKTSRSTPDRKKRNPA